MFGFGAACSSPNDDDPGALLRGVTGKPISDWPDEIPHSADASAAQAPALGSEENGNSGLSAPNSNDSTSAAVDGGLIGLGDFGTDAGLPSDPSTSPVEQPDPACCAQSDSGCGDAGAGTDPADAGASCTGTVPSDTLTCVLAVDGVCVSYARP